MNGAQYSTVSSLTGAPAVSRLCSAVGDVGTATAPTVTTGALSTSIGSVSSRVARRCDGPPETARKSGRGATDSSHPVTHTGGTVGRSDLPPRTHRPA